VDMVGGGVVFWGDIRVMECWNMIQSG
jgi:hypothetical protein